MRVTDQQVGKLFMEYQKGGQLQLAAVKAGMARKTAAKYVRDGRLPSERQEKRRWRTRANPFAAHWQEVETMLSVAWELEAKSLFEWLQERYPGEYQEGQVRTFQRQVRRWRALHGGEKEVFFPQEHRPGVRLETDFTCLNRLGITVGGEEQEAWLCHTVLSYSNWQWGTLCRSESLLSLREGLQAALRQLGHVPAEHWTDRTTAATHALGGEEEGRRGFNDGYLQLMAHFGLEPRTINRASPQENGDVESANGAFKRRLKQHLLLRGNSDFSSADEVRLFLEALLHKANRGREKRLAEELAVMRPLRAALLPEYVEEDVGVSRWSTIRVDRRVYSVPSRLIGETVRVRRYAERIEVYLAGELPLTAVRLTGDRAHAINYRHVIEWLIRKPGAFAQYRYRTDLFPSVVFRRAYDRLCCECAPRLADVEYLRLLRQAARTMESEVERVLLELERRTVVPRWSALQEFWPSRAADGAVDLPPLPVRLDVYDTLFSEVER